MTILGLDTATARGSLALVRGGALLAEAVLEERAWHAPELLARLQALLGAAGLAPAGLSGIGLTTGPGSFTGVRVGMATAKGMAYALRIGLAGLSTLEGLALAAIAGMTAGGPIVPVLEAGRGEVYAAPFAFDGRRAERRGPDRSWRPEDLAATLPRGATLVGDGSARVLAAAGGAAGALSILTPVPPLAPAIALWAADVIQPGRGYEPGGLRPNYVRPSDAEASRERS